MRRVVSSSVEWNWTVSSWVLLCQTNLTKMQRRLVILIIFNISTHLENALSRVKQRWVEFNSVNWKMQIVILIIFNISVFGKCVESRQAALSGIEQCQVESCCIKPIFLCKIKNKFKIMTKMQRRLVILIIVNISKFLENALSRVK